MSRGSGLTRTNPGVQSLQKQIAKHFKEGDAMGEFEELTMRVLALPSTSRAELAEFLMQSLDEIDNQEIKSAWLTEIHRTDQEIRAGASVTRPADEVLKEARRQLRCLE